MTQIPKLYERYFLTPDIFILLLSIVTAPCYGQYEWNDENPTLKISMPASSGIYNVQPVNIMLTNIDKKDGLKKLTLKVTTNPAQHQDVLSAEFSSDFKVTGFNTRVRLAGKGKSKIEAVAETHSGKVLKVIDKIKHKQGVDFSDKAILTKRLIPNTRFLSGPIGITRARFQAKNNIRQLSATIYHPMLPQIGKEAPDLLSNLVINYRGYLLGNITLNDAISTDPFIAIVFTDTKSGKGPVSIQWTDNKGNKYQPEKIE